MHLPSLLLSQGLLSFMMSSNNPRGLSPVDRDRRIMSTLNRRRASSSPQYTDTSADRQPESNDAAWSAPSDHAVNTSDTIFNETAYPNAAPDQLLPPPDFRPFFTLIEDPDTGEHHHPSVHYIFSDDNPDFVTSAIVDAIDQEQANTSSGPPPNTDRERMILIDVESDGKTIREVQSLSPSWQILKSTVGQAPSWADEVSRKDIPGLMLTIQGMDSRKLRPQPNRRRNSQEDTMARIEAMIGGYNECLATLESVARMDYPDNDEEAPAEATALAVTMERDQSNDV